MTYQQFVDHLRTHDSYLTPGDHRPRPFPSLRFFPGFVFNIARMYVHVRSLKNSDEGMWLGSFNIFRQFERLGGAVRINGLQHLRAVDGPPVIISNHMSSLETVVLPSILSSHCRCTFILKKALVKYPMLGYVLRRHGVITLDRKNAKEDLKASMDGGKEQLSRGTGVVVFPQSTRSAEFKPDNFNTLGLRIARGAKATVLPMCVLTDMWGNGKLFKDLGKIDPTKNVVLEFGEPFTVGDLKADHQRIVEFIKSCLGEWRDLRPVQA